MSDQILKTLDELSYRMESWASCLVGVSLSPQAGQILVAARKLRAEIALMIEKEKR